MKPYVLTEEAELDFYLTSDRIARRSPEAALRWEAKILDALDHLADWPQTGRIRPEYAPAPFRFWTLDSFLIVYNPAADPLEVADIFHGARNLSRLLAARFAELEEE